MNNYYSNFTQKFNKIFYRGYRDGRRIQGKIDYSPSLYVKTEKPTEFKSLFGSYLEERTFETIGEAKAFVKENSEFLAIHGNTKYEYAFIADKFRDEMDVKLEDLTIHSIDIETKTEGPNGTTKFPDLKEADQEILLITIIDFKTKELITFGSQSVDTKRVKNYVRCENEEDLLRKFTHHVITTDPDIITGWNVKYFDISYICTRMNRILGNEFTQKLSPFSMVERKISMLNDREQIEYDIVGRSVLDLLDLYKKFRFITRESYKLDHIAEVELGKKKLENPYETFKEFYQKDFTLFTEYNQRDTELVDELESELGLIYLAVTSAYLSRINFTDVYSPIKTWESYINSSLLKENTFVPIKKMSGDSGYSIEGGYVKEPVPGLYKWIVSFDFTSLYPKIIEALNMSPECLIGMKPVVDVNSLLHGYKNPDASYTMAANGAQFSKENLGIMTRLTAELFAKRKAAKDEMKVKKGNYNLIMEELKRRGINTDDL